MTTICRFPRPGRSAPDDLTELPSYDETYVTAMPRDGSLILSDVRAPQGTRPVRTAVSTRRPDPLLRHPIPKFISPAKLPTEKLD